MALASLIFGNKRTELQTPGDKLGILTIDATLRSSHSAGAQITKRELEKGTQVNDHLVASPESVVIEGVISETPLDLFGSIAGSAVGASASLLSKQLGDGATLAAGLLGGTLLNAISGSRSRDGFEFLVSLQKKRILFDLVTGLKNYKNMMLTSITANKSAQIGEAIQFTATMEQITFVESGEITLSEKTISEGIGASAAGNVDLGKQSANAAGSDTSGNGSLLFKAFGGFF